MRQDQWPSGFKFVFLWYSKSKSICFELSIEECFCWFYSDFTKYVYILENFLDNPTFIFKTSTLCKLFRNLGSFSKNEKYHCLIMKVSKVFSVFMEKLTESHHDPSGNSETHWAVYTSLSMSNDPKHALRI